MAFSRNQNQLVSTARRDRDDLRKAKKARPVDRGLDRVNTAAPDYGEERLGERYLRVRFGISARSRPRPCDASTASSGSTVDAEAAAAEVQSAGHSRPLAARRKGIVATPSHRRARARARFGYL